MGSRTVATPLICPTCSFNCASSKSKTSNGTLLSIPSNVPKLFEQLDKHQAGIVCVTKENQATPQWKGDKAAETIGY